MSLLSLLFACSAKATIVLAASWIAVRFLSGAAASLRHLIWTCGLIGILLLPFLHVAVPAWSAGPLGKAVAFLESDAPSRTPRPASASPGVKVRAVIVPPDFFQPRRWVMFAWLLGVALFLARILIGWLALWRTGSRAGPVSDEKAVRLMLKLARGSGMRRSIRLVESASASAMPATWGLMSSRILLPRVWRDWPDEKLRFVLSHEIAHIRRLDWPLRLLAEFSCSIFWFHPLVWFAARQMHNESELACDDSLIGSGIDPAAYAGALLEIARNTKGPSLSLARALAMARTSNLERRFVVMLDPNTRRDSLSRKKVCLACTTALLLLVPLAALRAPAQESSGRFTGVVYDPSGLAVPNATVVMANQSSHTKDMTTSDAAGNFRFTSLPAGRYELRVLKPGFAVFVIPSISLDPGRESAQNVTLGVGPLAETVDVPGVSASKDSDAGGGKAIRVGDSVQRANLIHKVNPIYPENAKAAGIQGAVLLQAVIGTDGGLLSLRVMNGQIDPDLARAAVEAVNQWRYKPTLLNGDPIEVVTEITVNFTLSE